MKFLKYSFITLATLVLLASAGYLFAASGLQSKPGYAELTMPGWFSANTQVALNLGPGGVKPVRWMANRIFDESDEEMDLSKRVILSVLQDLEGVQLRVYEVENNRPVFDQAIDETMVSLKQEDWQILLRVREDKERIVVMQSEDDGLIYGLSVLASTPENAVFMNLVGQINPESLAMLAESLN